jgi:hypothetical protein
VEEAGELFDGVVEEVNIAFAWPEVRDKLLPSLRIAIDFGDETTAGFIASVIVSAHHVFQRLAAGRSRSAVIDAYFNRHQELWDYFNVL